MSVATIRGKLKTMIESVTSIGKVYDYQRLVKREEDFQTLFRDTTIGKVRFWEITRRESSESYAATNRISRRTHAFIVDGFHEVDDANASEKTFQDLVESVIDKFRGNQNLEGLTGIEDLGNPPRVTINNVSFGNRILHHAEIEITVMERIQF